MLSPAQPPPVYEPVAHTQGNARRGNRRRLLVFAVAFAVTAMPSLLWVFLQPAEYRASAILQINPGVLTPSVPPPIGALQQAESADGPRPLATEVQVLRSRPLIESALARLAAHEAPTAQVGGDLVAEVQGALEVHTFEDTRVVQIDATLPERERVAPLVNALVAAYRERLSSSFGNASQEALMRVDEEVRGLDAQVSAKRRAIEAFRAQHAIVSSEAQENEVLARLRGLNTSLAAANDKLAAAEGRLRSLEQSAQAGKTVVRAKDDPTLASMEQRASLIRARLREQERNFTPAYLALDPQARSERAQLAEIEEQIRVQRGTTQQTALAEAQEDVEGARAAAARLREQIAGERQMAQSHIARLSQYKGMQDELAELERLYRDRAQRKASLAASETARAPALEVMQNAVRPERAFRPDYATHASVALAASLLVALLAMGIVELFNRSERGPGVLIAQPITVHGLPLAGGPAPALARAQGATPVLDSRPPPLLLPDGVLPGRELRDSELAALWHAAASRARAAIGLLLSGLSVEEVAALVIADVDLAGARVSVGGGSPRTVSVQPAVVDALRRCEPLGEALYGPVADAAAAREALEADLLCAAHDGELTDAGAVTPAAVRHAYLLHLVRQGARMSDITALAGRMSPALIAAYAAYAPSGARVALDATRAAYPLLARLKETLSAQSGD